MKSDAKQFLALLFLSRDVAHKAHLNTKSYAEHKALGHFYDDVIELADKFAEAYMGRTGERIGEMPDMKNPKGDIAKILKVHMELIEETRGFVAKEDTPLQNIIDEIVGLYLSTLYKLTLK
jgi:hypothetical protein